MPQDLPGFYYDADKNRYFPLKSPIPGSSSRNPSSSASTSSQKPPPKSTKTRVKDGQQEITAKVVKMLHMRELCGNSMISNKKKVNFQEQYRNIQTSKPTIWKYKGTERTSDAALEHVHVSIQTPDGLAESELLLTGGLNNKIFCSYEVGCVGEHTNDGAQHMPDVLQRLNIEKQTSLNPPKPLWNAMSVMPSYVSCIKIPRGYYHLQATDDSSVSHAIITTLGSETSGGSVYSVDLSEPLEYVDGINFIGQRIDHISSVSNSTIWTADCNSNGNQTVIGTDSGAALVHMESGRKSWIFRSKSDVLSLQLDCSRNIVLCGLRNGAILTVDTRQKPEDLRDRHLPKHQIPFPSLKTSQSSSGRNKKRENKLFEVRGNVHDTRTMFMPSSVSCLVAVKLYDQYFLASSMDGTVRLYDHRMNQRGAVQMYEGNFNSHTRIQMGVDPSERFVMSGGEDSYLRVWRLKSGEMLYEDKFMNSVPLVVCWPKGDGRGNSFPGAWLGSREGVFYVDTS